MIEFINEPVSVEVFLDREDAVRPRAFVWRGRRFRIESWGRESIGTQDGRSCHCYLVQTGDLEAWELCQDTKTAQWTLTRHWASRHRAV